VVRGHAFIPSLTVSDGKQIAMSTGPLYFSGTEPSLLVVERHIQRVAWRFFANNRKPCLLKTPRSRA